MKGWMAPCLFALAACTGIPSPQTGDCPAGKCDETADAGAAAEAFCDEVGGQLPDNWISGGPDCGSEPTIQVHAYDADTFILRQSLCTSGEAPFMYLLFGDDKVLMEDTGDDVGVPIPLIETVDQIISDWLERNGRDSVELIVVNSHAHGDHTAYNREFEQTGEATVVGFFEESISDFFGIDSWPDGSAELDLGNRAVDILPIPGHEDNHIALYDRSRGLLLTGDTFYPGRLFIRDFEQYRTSVRKLVDFSADRPLCHVLGTHIEMSNTPGQQYEFGADHHPDEHPLELSRDHLTELRDALDAMDQVEQEVHDDFIIFPL